MSPSPVPDALPPESIQAARELLDRKPLWYRLPAPLGRGFARQRQRDFVTISRVGPLIYLLFVLTGAVAVLQFGHRAFEGWNATVFWSHLGFNAVCLTIGLLLSRLPAVQERYLWLVALDGSLTLASPLIACLLVTEPLMQRELSYVVMLYVNFIILTLRAPLVTSALTCGLGLAMTALVVAVWDLKPNWAEIGIFYLGSAVVALFISAVTERLERLSYLRGVLLEHESAESQRLNARLAEESAETKRLNEVLTRMACQDPLSGLANRRHFNDVLEAEWSRAQRQRGRLALLFIDVDYFKRFNDTYGHAAGDQCLTAVANALQGSLLRPTDLAARYGGEEFVILLPDTDLAGAVQVAERVLAGVDALALPHAGSEVAPCVTISIGIAAQEAGAGTTAQLLERADQALYQAKAAGRHRVSSAD